MAMKILNLFESDRRSCIAGEDLEIGQVIRIADDGEGEREAFAAADGDTLKETTTGLAWKVKMDGRRLVTTTSLTAKQLRTFGDARTYLDSGDQMVIVRKGAIVELEEEDVHASLYTSSVPNVVVGDTLVVKDGLLAKSGTASANTSLDFARVYRVHGTSIFVELIK
jgi:hypothetical protein